MTGPRMLSPRCEATAYRIWGHCERIGWDCTIPEVAEALDIDVKHARRVIVKKNWGLRFRVLGTDNSASFSDEGSLLNVTDAALEAFAGVTRMGGVPMYEPQVMA